MNKFYLIICALLFMASSCKQEYKYLCLNDLSDKEIITGTLQIDCFRYDGKVPDQLFVNTIEHNTSEDLTLDEAGFYRIELIYKGLSQPVILRIVLLDKERGLADWGLKKWTPPPVSYSEYMDENISFIYPKTVPENIHIPFVVKIDDADQYYQAICAGENINIKRGIGSCQIPSVEIENSVFSIGGKNIPLNLQASNMMKSEISGTIAENISISENSFLHISSDLTIPENFSLTIEKGVFILIDPEVNIYNNGTILLNGTEDFPLTFTCSEPGSLWGGFISNSTGNRLIASHCIFTQSGFHDSEEYRYGHGKRQALFYSEDGVLDLNYCYIIDNAGQIFYPLGSTLDIRNSLVQRAKTGGQVNYSTLRIDSSIFTDFPNDSDIYQDEDNDGLYINESDAVISNSSFMYAKDDGLDSGGVGGRKVEVYNCCFEASFHEGAALSSAGEVNKTHIFKHCTFLKCGQGLELGFSSTNHIVLVDSCYFEKNNIGIRYGDNYTMSHKGHISIANSNIINSFDKDIWNMNRETWSADTTSMEFFNVHVSIANPMYPDLLIYE